ncbi:pentatricopeptide repeat-containing protein At5g11310, mitochondrial [Euphorbia lathyris]|uniref:pentatricopeptide repeat-containing protein At5g11310, mitochondrial n=1 Tax=Euphorbia lathyris TaxID=212925 RepID=UPI0033144ACB
MKYLKPRTLILLSLSNCEKQTRRFFSPLSSPKHQSRICTPGIPFVTSPPPPHRQLPSPTLDAISNPNYSEYDFSILCNHLRDPDIRPGESLVSALDGTKIQPEPSLLLALFDLFDSSPKLLHDLFIWAESKPKFQSSATLFNSVVNALGKVRKFDSAWCLVLDRIGGVKGPNLVSTDTFAMLIRRYTRAGMPQAAIRTYEYSISLNLNCDSDNGTCLLEILLDSLCKEGQVRAGKEYFDRKKQGDPCWIPSVRIYNILLNGWFRSKKLKHAETLWLQMKEENVRPTVVTYGTLIEGYCRMRRVEQAIDLLDAMRRQGIEANAIVYNAIIDALAEAGRFKEASGMMEYLMQSESGPTIYTYNSLVKGYCKAKDVAGASNILKIMISRGFIPMPSTYNYFFKYYSKNGKIEEGMKLYTKMIEAGYSPDRFTYHLLLKMLCEEDRYDLAVSISKEMRGRGYDMDLSSNSMLIHLMCRMHRLEEAYMEFEEMLRRGIVPQYLTFQRLNYGLKKQGMTQMAWKLNNMMSSIPHSTNLPNTFNAENNGSRKTCIMKKAEVMSQILKKCNDPREVVKQRGSSKNPISVASQLIEDIKGRAKQT